MLTAIRNVLSQLMRPIFLGVVACAMLYSVPAAHAVGGGGVSTGPGGSSTLGGPSGARGDPGVSQGSETLEYDYTECRDGVVTTVYKPTGRHDMSVGGGHHAEKKSDAKCNQRPSEKPGTKAVEAAKGGLGVTGLGVAAAIAVGIAASSGGGKGTTGTTGTR